MIREAAEFAAEVHKGKLRKGSSIPYIVHPLETAVIVSGITQDEEVICAALLHDVIEDAGVTFECLEARFGLRVAQLVQAESEDKSRSWQERKQATIRRLETAPREVRIICLGDKVSNLRSTAADYLLHGDRVWEKFREKDRKKHEWYYRGVFQNLKELSGQAAYAEYETLMKKIFHQ